MTDLAVFRRSVSEEFLARQIASERAAKADEAVNRLLASWRRLVHTSFGAAWEDAGDRIAYERSIGVRPMAKFVSATDFQRNVGAVFDQVRKGEHITIRNHGRSQAVLISAEEYTQLLDVREQLDAIRRAEQARKEG